MARCGCAGSACGCLVVGGVNITVTGIGSATNPFIVNAEPTDLAGAITTMDTESVTLELLGAGTPADPMVLRATSILALTDLTDVNDTGPVNGDTIVWVGGGGGHWEFSAPTVAPGSVLATNGLVGDGSAGDPLGVAVSGDWGLGTLADWGADSTSGSPIYIDSTGELRSAPTGFKKVTSGARGAHEQGLRIFETDTLRSYISNGIAWEPIASGTGSGDSTIPVNLARTSVTGAVTAPAEVTSGPQVVRYNLTGNTVVTMPDGALGQAYHVYLDVVPNGFDFSFDGGAVLSNLSGLSRALVPMFWSGDAWFSQWQA